MEATECSQMEGDMDYGILKSLHDLMAIEVDLTASMQRSDEFDLLNWNQQYIAYSVKVKELMRKLLHKLENNYQYQKYLEEELKSLEKLRDFNPSCSDSSVHTPINVSKIMRIVNGFSDVGDEVSEKLALAADARISNTENTTNNVVSFLIDI